MEYEEKRNELIRQVRNYKESDYIEDTVGFVTDVIKVIDENENLDLLIFEWKKDEDGQIYRDLALPMDVLERINFGSVSFVAVNLSHFDLSKLHNVTLNPGYVYNSDLSYSNLSGVTLEENICGVNFYHANIDNVKGLSNETQKILKLRRKITEELEKLEDGIHISLDYDPRVVELILFDYITPTRKIFSLPKEVLKKIDFSNVSFDGFQVFGSVNGKNKATDFTGLYGVKINPQKIPYKDLSNSIFYGVEFIGPFDGAYIVHSNFAGSKNAFINPNNLYNSSGLNKDLIDLEGCVFKDVTFTEPFKLYKCKKEVRYHYRKTVEIVFKCEGTDFTGSKGTIIHTD